jgi:hypothetical protein
MDCRNILQSSVVPEVYKGVGGQKSIDTMMMMMILSKKNKIMSYQLVSHHCFTSCILL